MADSREAKPRTAYGEASRRAMAASAKTKTSDTASAHRAAARAHAVAIFHGGRNIPANTKAYHAGARHIHANRVGELAGKAKGARGAAGSGSSSGS